MLEWSSAQEWEQDWWGDCTNTYGEETKQLVYADCMGLVFHHDGKSPYNIDVNGMTILDVGGGPTSILLKCNNFERAKVVDPMTMPAWVLMRYKVAKIGFERKCGEDLTETGWDECWIYNVLQHTQDPQTVIFNMQKAAKLIRLFEWIDTPTNVGHPHRLTRKKLDVWLKGEGKIEVLKGQNTCKGKAYYGIFPTKE